MASELRGAKRTRVRERGTEPRASADGDECPVCLVAFTHGERTERARVVFPCSHAVCRTCDARMQERSYHSCPLCRTPREGYSQTEVDQASRERSLTDDLTDGLADGTAFFGFVNGDFRPAPAPVGIMRFRSEAQGDPFDVLRTGTLGDSVRDGSLRQRTRAALHGTRSLEIHAPDLTSEEEDDSVADSEGLDHVRRFVQQSGFADLITNHLLQPTDLPTFLAQHQQVTNDMNAHRGALSAMRPSRRFVLSNANHPAVLMAAQMLDH